VGAGPNTSSHTYRPIIGQQGVATSVAALRHLPTSPRWAFTGEEKNPPILPHKGRIKIKSVIAEINKLNSNVQNIRNELTYTPSIHESIVINDRHGLKFVCIER